MAVPTQKQLHRPFLEIVDGADDNIVPLQSIRKSLIERFALTEDDLLEKVPSGQQTRFVNRLYWAASYLRRAGLLESPSRARFQMTLQGHEALETSKGDIETGQLRNLIESRQRPISSERDVAMTEPGSIGVAVAPDPTDADTTSITPDELMGELYRELNNKLADELIESVKGVSADGFERLVVRLLEEMEYGEGQRVGRSGDGGIDGIINQDPLGLEKVYIQAKRWQYQVGEPEIRNFSGSLHARGASKGVFITTSTFSSTASETARLISAGNQFIRLIDGRELARLMIAHNVGVITEITYNVKKLDENYFSEDL